MSQRFSASGRRPRVLHIGKFYPPYKGGMETHLQELCRALAPYADVSVVVSNATRKTTREHDGEIAIHRAASWATVASAPICPTMVSAIRRTPADIVHLHCPNPNAVLAYFASGHSGQLVITYHSDVVRQRTLSHFYRPLFRKVAQRARAIVCFSPNYIDTSQALRPFRDKCHVIPHGIDPLRFEQVDQKAVARIRSQYANRIVLAVGRLVYYKGFEYLIRAISSTSASLVIIGTGPLRDKLRQVAQECGVADRVHLLGEVEDVAPYYHAAHVFALPSIARSEAFGIAQLEAMACGTPVVNTSLDSGVPFVSLDGESGLTVPPRDISALGRSINKILDDDQLHARLSEGARKRVQQHFTLDSMAKCTLQLYERILGDSPVALEIPELVTV